MSHTRFILPVLGLALSLATHAHAQEPLPADGERTAPTVLQLSWSELPDASSETTLATAPVLQLQIAPRRGDDWTAQVEVGVDLGAPQSVVRNLALTSRGTTVSIPLPAPAELAGRPVSSQLRATVRLFDAAGRIVETLTAPAVALHSQDGTSLTAVREGRLATHYDGGDLFGRFDNRGPDGPIPLSYDDVLPYGGLGPLVGAGEILSGLGPSLCAYLPTNLVDAAAGDIGNTPFWRAHGILLRVQGGGYDGMLRADAATGCAQIPEEIQGDPELTVTFYNDLELGPLDRRTRMQMFLIDEVATAWDDAGWPSDFAEPMQVHVIPAGWNAQLDGDRLHVLGGVATAATNLLAVAGAATQRWETLAQLGPDETTGLALVYEGCGGDDYSCGLPNKLYIYHDLEQDGAQHKFLVGHEVGHGFHQRQVGSISGDYQLNNNDGTCPSHISGDHALRSLEHDKAAFTEGFAHFLSAVAHNTLSPDEASFQYYKDDAGYAFDLVDVAADLFTPDPAGGGIDVRFWDCECEGMGPDELGPVVPNGSDCAEVGVELDWMRFYWHYLSDAGTAPNLGDILTQQDGVPFDQGVVYGQLQSEVSPTWQTRWDSLACVYGLGPKDDCLIP